MHRVIVVGSPRANGRSAALADELFNACIEECPEDGVSIVSVASIEVGPCRGCDACRAATQAPQELPEDDDTLAIRPLVAVSDAVLHRCAIHDDMTEVRKHLDAADELIVVAPVYFAGPPAQMKALMDRLQPYFWSSLRAGGQKRPCVLHVVGEGGDPHGFEPLVGTVRSAFSCAGFELELVLDWVGKITEDGEIVAEADEYSLLPVDGFCEEDFAPCRESGGEASHRSPRVEDDEEWDDCETVEALGGGKRPKLSLSDSSPKKGGASAAPKKQAKRTGEKHGSGKAGKASYGKNAPKKGGKRRG